VRLAFVDGDATRTSRRGARRELPTWEGAAVGIDGPAPSNRRAGEQWNLFLRWWSQWRNSSIIVQPETVLRWCREGWSGLWQYRPRGRWRGGRPRISNEIRQLIVRMARENFL